MNLSAFFGWMLAHPDEALTLASVIIAAFAAVNRWAVANKRDRLAMLTAALGRAAGRINELLRQVPVGMTYEQFRNQLIRSQAELVLAEFDSTAKKAGATVDKAVGIIDGELGKLPPPVTQVVQQAAVSAAGDVVDAIKTRILGAQGIRP